MTHGYHASAGAAERTPAAELYPAFLVFNRHQYQHAVIRPLVAYSPRIEADEKTVQITAM